MSKFVLLGSAALLALQAPAFAQEREREGKALIFCDGTVQEITRTNTENSPFNLSVAGVIPSTIVAAGGSGGASDLDTYNVTFSAQTRHTTGGTLFVRAQVSINGGVFFDINPIGPNLFHTGAQMETHTMSWCRRLAASTSATFRIFFNEAGAGFGQIDNYTTRVERSN